KGLVEKYSGIIESYVTRRGWPMEETKTGLWYMIYEKGQGEMTGKGKYATINYTVHLLDGTFCYSSDSLGAKTFKIGQGGVEPGLEQGILLMKEGDKAKFILPPYIGHGLLGDSKKIPRLAVIIYDVELLEVSCRQN
ncbi:MAG: FKBP-type peptidyl-prolyl cis-trans isomerase, partial [Cyclobacteriaceae bacterium]